jgi:hypothetical protein
MKKSPLAQVNEQFGSKEKLVDALIALPESVVERPAEDDKDAFRHRMLTAANAKLLRLHRVGRQVSETLRLQATSNQASVAGSKAKLVDAILDLRRRSKDADYRTKLNSLPLGKLYDQVSVLEAATKRASGQAKPAAKKAPAAAKPAAKPAAKKA